MPLTSSAIENRVAIRFAVVAAILIAATGASFLSVAQFLELSGRVEHSYLVIQSLKDLVSLMKSAEIGHRGYLLTLGREDYLEPYLNATREIDRKLDEFGALIRDDPVEQQEWMRQLKPLVRRKFTLLGEIIGLQKRGEHDAALRLVNSDQGQRIIDKIREIVGRMENYERDRLAMIGAEVRSVRNWMIAIKVACFVLVIALLVAVDRLVRHEMRERRRSEEAQARLVEILEATTDFVGIADTSGRVVYVSRAGLQIVGKDTETVSQTCIADYHPEWALRIVEEQGIPTAIGEGKWCGETALILADEGEVPVSQVILSHKDSRGEIRYLSTIARDITERKRAEASIRRSHDELEQRVRERTAELERTNIALKDEVAERWKAVEEARRACAAAEMATKSKGEFLANMSHEIRTPMNGVLGMLDLVIRSGLPRRQHEFLNLARSSAEMLLRLLNDILDFSKIEAGRLDLESIPFNIHETLGDSLKSSALSVHEKGLELSCSIAPDVPRALVGDPGRLSQVVGNLVGNAKKFTERGEIDVRVDRVSQDAAGVLLHFAVRDTGIGIPPEKQRLIFSAFTQADSSTTRQYGGTGLGLAICSHLVEAMGGRIWLDSEVGRGSTFHFTARFGVHDADLDAPTPPRLDVEGLPVLVVDDNPTQCRILEELLTGWGMRPTTVNSGPAAIAAMNRARESGAPFPLVLLDVVMPWMDGFNVAEWIQRDPELAGTAIMMLSSADVQGDSERCAALGVSVLLRKPVKASELFDSILNVLGVAAGPRIELSSTAEDRTLPDPARRLKILLAEDTPINQRLAVTLLEDRGHTVVVADDGQEALDLLATRSFDLVLMDVQMPRVDGFQATAAIRAKEASGRHIPIIAMTAHAMKGDRERCLAAGMDGYISKPIRPERFLSVVEGWSLRPEGPAEVNGEDRDPSPDVVFDLDAAMARVRGDGSLLAKMGELFLADYPGVLAEIDAALLAGDPGTLERAGHRLKGSAGTLSAPRVVEAAQRLEDLGRAGDLAQAKVARASLEHELIRFEQALKVWEKGEDD